MHFEAEKDLNMKETIVIVGAGAAGFFSAIRIASLRPDLRVIVLEKSDKPLYKVSISGGGRCNVTHASFDAKALSKNYPRGEKELIGPFHSFGPQHTIDWFEERGVKIKEEDDGRMFPVTDDSATIINCFYSEAKKRGVELHLSNGLSSIRKLENGNWDIVAGDGKKILSKAVLIASGSNLQIWKMLEDIGHHIVTPIPSLFTFNTKDTRLRELMGLSISSCVLKVKDTKLKAEGPLLITHWGLSGPAILRLSAWGAEILASMHYKFILQVNWCGALENYESVRDFLTQHKIESSRKLIFNTPLFTLPSRLWINLMRYAGITEDKRWADLNKDQFNQICQTLLESEIQIQGKSTFKDEFVTCGGVDLSEVNFKTMESKLFPGLYFAGEVLNIDAITGGFNFQAAWTTAWIAAASISKQ